MKRSGELPRRTPMPKRSAPLDGGGALARGNGLQRTGGLDRGGELARRTEIRKVSPKRAEAGTPALARRSGPDPGETAAKRILRERSGGVCEGCRAARATDFSHRWSEGQGGPWCPCNGLDLCRTGCHAWIHAEQTLALGPGWRLLPKTDPRTVSVVLPGWGEVWLLCDGGFSYGPPDPGTLSGVHNVG